MKVINILLCTVLFCNLVFAYVWIYSLEHNQNLLLEQVNNYQTQDYQKHQELEKDIRLLQQDVLILEGGVNDNY